VLVSTDDGQLELFDGDDPPTVELEQRPPRPRSSWLRLRWVLVAFGVLVIGGLTLGIVVFNAAAPDEPRGAATPTAATRQFVAALNAGDRAGAADIACDEFADQARAAARSGQDPDISYTLVTVTSRDKDHATAELAQRMRIAGAVQNVPYRVALLRGAQRWLVCGRAG
jgi:hypothetical protein